MTIKSMHHVGMTVTDLAASVAFFEALGMELEGKAHMEGEFVDGVIGLDGSKSEIAMLRTPTTGTASSSASSRRRTPSTAARTPRSTPWACGTSRSWWTTSTTPLARIKPLGGEVVRNVETYQGMLKTCYVRGPEGMLIELCEYFS